MTAQPENRYTFDRVVRLTLSVAALAGIIALTQFLSDVLLPFAAAVVLAYLLNPLVTWLERKTRRRGFAVALTLVGLGTAAVILVAILVPVTLGQVRRFRDDVVKLRDELASSSAARIPSPEAHAPAEPPGTAQGPATTPSALGWTELKDGWTDYRTDAVNRPRGVRLAEFRRKIEGTYVGDALDDVVRYSQSDDFRAFLLQLAKKLAVGGWSVVAFVVNLVLGLTGLIIVLLYMVFLLLDFPEYSRTWSTFLPPHYREATVDFLTQFNEALRRYLRGQSLVALLTAALLAVGFTVIGLPMAVPFGLFVGMLAMVPYLPATALVPAILLAGLRAIESDAGFLMSVVLTLGVFAVVQVIQDSLITPRVMGKATGLRPIAILLGVFIWGKLLGFLGLMLSIPLTCLAIAYYRRYVLLHAPQTVNTTDRPIKPRKEKET